VIEVPNWRRSALARFNVCFRPFADIRQPSYTGVVLRKFRRAWHAAKALELFGREDAAGALRRIEAMRLIKPLSHAEQMWTYFPLAMEGRFDEAFDALDEVCRNTDGLADDNDRFINFCARALRASSHGDSPLHDRLIEQAKKLMPKASVRMWSQLIGPDVR
jgi:hypothetical protein